MGSQGIKRSMRPISPDRIKMLLGSSTSIRVFGSWLSIGKIIMLCNILLALYNFMCFTASRGLSVPCIVVLNNSGLHDAAEKQLARTTEPRDSTVLTKMKIGALAIQRIPAYRLEHRGSFIILGDYVKANGEQPEFNQSITYTTQATHEFLFPHVEELCKRWEGPVSISVYAPGSDLAIVNRKIAHLLKCAPCVANHVTFHVVYHRSHVPPNIPTDPKQYVQSQDVNCTNLQPHDTGNYRKDANLTYPINVLRNAARLRAQTKYVLASDIELYPSANIISRFIQMVSNDSAPRSVYTLPIFEIEKGYPVPREKRELQDLYKQKQAIFFHRFVCDQCQNFPLRDRWINTTPNNASMLSVFVTTKRRRDRSSWEPIYIGTNDEPLYAEELSWEGKRDKMSQMFELCLIDYDFKVLNDAFLCHAPGIKKLIKEELAWRSKFVRQNNAMYKRIMSRIKAKHPNGVKPHRCI
ncbi:beta-1,4-glucuronyltransferase 1-like isoform X2 [Varroa jacobsoni]|uniref:N-acetyllactosaminide beta-1,3-N-acetylglucosaminyltransferase n=1 Tax=Varroa destructor TaxID=109461 RepID=A0A7M7JAJ2_VARDE|nr:beta-1,4-glucuronyltransferase 1-like isoform X1 [Varroa destructor]XP_022649198.1 beta-1,4-glucuronyltransferase 1-like isoform X1 [Varroa destructor]XP_022699681.1 beta-1,4-glucuronyltransferase 1-like isoform X2 [Varroa jacobsoni]